MIYIYYNPNAANGNGKGYALEAGAAAAKAFGEDIPLEMTDMTDLKLNECVPALKPTDKLILCGGDGTLSGFCNRLVEGLSGPEANYPGKLVHCELYMYKAGTGNDFLRDVAPKDSVLVQINDFVQHLPRITVKDSVNDISRLFINGIGYGIDGMCCEVADKLKAKGKTNLNYGLITVKLLIHGYNPPDAQLTVDGVTTEYKRVWLASAMNGRYYGGGMIMAPNQDRLSGKLCSITFQGSSRLRTLTIFPSLFSGKHVNYKRVVHECFGTSVSVKFSAPMAMQIDGDTVLGVREYSVSM